ncbi:hypothetical protein LINPERPRIM_LOCUS16159 [Linum perenne]
MEYKRKFACEELLKVREGMVSAKKSLDLESVTQAWSTLGWNGAKLGVLYVE